MVYKIDYEEMMTTRKSFRYLGGKYCQIGRKFWENDATFDCTDLIPNHLIQICIRYLSRFAKWVS